MADTYIITRSDDRRLVHNRDCGWVDRDAGPGPSHYPEVVPNSGLMDLPPGSEWEKVEDA